MEYKDYYKILEIDKKATSAQVKKAYRTLAKKNHPDKNLNDKKAEERFKLVNEANEVLGNSEKRKKYDDLGENWQQNQNVRNQQQNQNQYNTQGKQSYNSANADGFSDFFEQFFSQQRDKNSQQNQARKGGDYETKMEISIQEAYSGTTRIIQLEDEKLRITTKPGAYSNQQLRIKNKGANGNQPSNRGDLFINIHVADNIKFIRKGDNLYQTENIDLFDAILGNHIIIESLSGKLKINIEAGSQNGKTIRLKGKGMPVYDKPTTFGDLYVILNVVIPVNLTEKQIVLFKELKVTF